MTMCVAEVTRDALPQLPGAGSAGISGAGSTAGRNGASWAASWAQRPYDWIEARFGCGVAVRMSMLAKEDPSRVSRRLVGLDTLVMDPQKEQFLKKALQEAAAVYFGDKAEEGGESEKAPKGKGRGKGGQAGQRQGQQGSAARIVQALAQSKKTFTLQWVEGEQGPVVRDACEIDIAVAG